VSVDLPQKGLPHDEFTFIVNHKRFPISVVEAVLLSPTDGDQLQVNAYARRFAICDPEIDSTDFTSLQSHFSGVETIRQKSHQKSLILLSRQLDIVGFERLFSSLWSNSTVTLSTEFAAHLRLYLESISDVSLLFVDALDSLFSSESFWVDSQDVLLRLLVPLGHPPLLRQSSGNVWELQQSLTFVKISQNRSGW
jgi:hypothetical protein